MIQLHRNWGCWSRERRKWLYESECVERMKLNELRVFSSYLYV